MAVEVQKQQRVQVAEAPGDLPAQGAQDLDADVVDVDGAHGVAALSRGGRDVVADVGRELDDQDDLCLEIHVRPAKRHELADAQPRAQEERRGGPAPVSLLEGEDVPRLVR